MRSAISPPGGSPAAPWRFSGIASAARTRREGICQPAAETGHVRSISLPLLLFLYANYVNSNVLFRDFMTYDMTCYRSIIQLNLLFSVRCFL